jgi:hypothetical protein
LAEPRVLSAKALRTLQVRQRVMLLLGCLRGRPILPVPPMTLRAVQLGAAFLLCPVRLLRGTTGAWVSVR